MTIAAPGPKWKSTTVGAKESDGKIAGVMTVPDAHIARKTDTDLNTLIATIDLVRLHFKSMAACFTCPSSRPFMDGKYCREGCLTAVREKPDLLVMRLGMGRTSGWTDFMLKVQGSLRDACSETPGTNQSTLHHESRRQNPSFGT